MKLLIKEVKVFSITRDVAEVTINNETVGFICRQKDVALPFVAKLSGGYQLGQFDCNQCAIRGLVELDTRVSVLNEQHQEEYAFRSLGPEHGEIVRSILEDISIFPSFVH